MKEHVVTSVGNKGTVRGVGLELLNKDIRITVGVRKDAQLRSRSVRVLGFQGFGVLGF